MAAGVTLTKQDGKLGVPVPGATKALVIGPSSGGTKELLYTFSQTSAVNAAIGHGPAQVAAECILQLNGGSVDVYVASGSIAATSTTLVSSSTPAVTKSGTPYNTYDFIGTIVTAGALDVARWKYTLDGENYSPEQTLVGSHLLQNTGLTLTFASGSYAVGDTFTFTAYAPQMNAADLNTCLNDYALQNTTPTLIYVANDSQSAVSGSALFSAMDTQLSTLDNIEVFTQAVVPTGGADDTASTIKAAFASVAASAGNVIVAGAERARRLVPSSFQGYVNPRLPFAQAFAERAHGIKISTNPARYADGQLTGWSDPTYDELLDGSTYEPAKLVAPRRFQGDAGLFVNQSLLKSQVGSDYLYWQWGRVINRAAEVTARALRRFVNSSVRVLTDGTGYIDPRDKAVIEGYVQKQLNATIMLESNAEGTPGHASAIVFSVNGQTNVLTTSTLEFSVALIPLANVSNLVGTIGFTDSIPVVAAA